MNRIVVALGCLAVGTGLLGAQDSIPKAASKAVSKTEGADRGPPPDRPVVEREYQVTVGVTFEATGSGKRFTAGTAVPIDWPEQKVELLDADVSGCSVRIASVGEGGAMMIVQTKALQAGERARAIHRYRVTVKSQPRRYRAEEFPDKRPPAEKKVRNYLIGSPGIQAEDRTVKALAAELSADAETDWQKLQRFFLWVHNEIKYRQGTFTSAKDAVKDRVGDCEEKAATFIALARASGIPARLVWTPGHCWAEFHLVDKEGTGHWIPAHTAGMPWFGYLESATVVLQKGDRFKIPEQKAQTKRLLGPFYIAVPPQPKVEFVQKIEPVVKK